MYCLSFVLRYFLIASTDICISSTSCLIRTKDVLSFSSIAFIFAVVSFSNFFIGFIIYKRGLWI